jgi:suppressor for copper-sensitivity B
MRFLAILSLVLMLSAPAMADEQRVTASLSSPQTAAGTADTVKAVIEVTPQSGWKTYWRTPGDAGLAPGFDWKGSTNFKSATVSYPAPHRVIEVGLDNLVYKERTLFPVDIAVEKPGEAVSLKLRLDLLVCKEICVPEKRELTLDLPAGEATPSADAKIHDEAVAALPKKAEGEIVFTSAWLDAGMDNKSYVIVKARLKDAPGADADLFIEHPAPFTYGKPVFSKDGEETVMRAEIHSTETFDAMKAEFAKADFTLTYADKGAAYEGTLPLSGKPEGSAPLKTPHPVPVAEKIESLSLKIILAALLGGLILNLMPCVLPVLSLKVLSVLSHGGKDSRMSVFKNFIGSALGIVASFWAMAGALVAVKSAGGAVGWGIQFQNPVFLVFLIVVLLLFAVNMWGLFEIPLPRFIAHNLPRKHEHEPTFFGHFLTGAFATLLATPCTAPFLGTAVGFALARGPFEIFAIFTFLGLGLAAPYILLSVSPKLIRLLPKPGAWMVTLKKILALSLVATAAWLAHVLFTITTMPALEEGWAKFDQAAIAQHVAEGKTVFVDVTADWCLTCKANKKFVLETPDVEAALSAENIVKMQADWTQRDEATGAYLQSFGRYGIPFNVVYGPAAPNGLPLPELLTKKDIVDALQAAGGE